MARGQSGRIVLEVDSELKNELYSAISKKGYSKGLVYRFCRTIYKISSLGKATHI